MNPQKGGVQKVSILLANFFISCGHKVYYLIYERDEEDNYEYPVEIFYLPGSNFFSGVNLVFYHNLIQELAIDIVLNHDASNDRSTLFLNTGKLEPKKISLHHNDPLIRWNKNRFKSDQHQYLPAFLLEIYSLYKTRKEINFLINKNDKVVFLSKAFLDKIKSQTGIVSDKLLAISNPIVIADNNHSYRKKKQVLYVGRIELKQKRPDILLFIWSKMHRLFPDWELIILGDGPDKNYIQQRSINMGLNNISFKGFVHPEPYYQDASIICMTSDYEGFGMVLIEAMQYGVLPMAFDNWASLKDIIVDNETGLLIPSNDIENYVFKLSEIIKDEELREKIAGNAIKHVQKFDINYIGEEWLNLFEDLNSTH